MTGKYFYTIPKQRYEDGIIQGSSAYPGKVQGIVRIIHDPMADNIFLQGDILATGMIQPEYIHIAKKAGIIIDTGGVLSHAAILARKSENPA